MISGLGAAGNGEREQGQRAVLMGNQSPARVIAAEPSADETEQFIQLIGLCEVRARGNQRARHCGVGTGKQRAASATGPIRDAAVPGLHREQAVQAFPDRHAGMFRALGELWHHGFQFI